MNFWGLILGVLLIGTSALADRSVSVAVPKGDLELVNPSSGNVIYSVECYDKVDGTNLTSSYTSSTLGSKKSVRILSGGVCAGGAVPAKTLTQGPMFCNGNVNYASAATLCGPSSTLCTFAKLNTVAVVPSDFLTGYWIKPHASVTTWSQTYDSWGKNYPQDTAGKKGYAPQTYNKGSSYACAEDATPTNAVTYCSSLSAGSTSSGSLCCPTNNGFVSCKVTIHSSGTVAGGHLQSPQFKGGAAF